MATISSSIARQPLSSSTRTTQQPLSSSIRTTQQPLSSSTRTTQQPLSSSIPINRYNRNDMYHISVPNRQITPSSVIPVSRSAPFSIIGGSTYEDRLNRKERFRQVPSSSLEPINDITDNELFEAAISETNPFAGHSYDSLLYGDPRS